MLHSKGPSQTAVKIPQLAYLPPSRSAGQAFDEPETPPANRSREGTDDRNGYSARNRSPGFLVLRILPQPGTVLP